MLLLALLMLLVCIGIPLAFSWRVLRLSVPSKSAWLLLVTDAAVFVALVLIVGRWDTAGYHTRFIVLGVFVFAVIWSLGQHWLRPWKRPEQPLHRKYWTTLVSLAVFGAALVYAVYGSLAPPNARELTFPLEGGRFIVAQGGGISLLNHHAGHLKQRFAADITALNRLGFRAAGLTPKELDRYQIYGASVVSPCAGKVLATQDDLPDLTPPESDPEHARGNHVIIDCGGFNVELAHLQPGSIVVTAGAQVSAGDSVGKVGNSGNTTEPHLHVHALDPRTSAGLPMSFWGRTPIRNTVYLN